MDIKCFLNNVCKEIKYKPARKDISEELEVHIQEIKKDYISDGMNEKEAEEKAVSQMGKAEDIGRQLNRIHKPHLDWKLLILIVILMGFNLLISVLKESTKNDNYLWSTIIYMLIGIIISIGIYFFDYRKLKKQSFLIYLFATIIMILPMAGMGYFVRGVLCLNILGFSFFPGTMTITLYIIAFVGFIIDYKKDNIIKLKNQNKRFSINKDFIKIVGLTVLSLIIMSTISTLTNTLILSFVYLVITTIKFIVDAEKTIKKLFTVYGTIGVVAIFLIVGLNVKFFKSDRILASFNPEIEPNGTGYIGMLQKEILQNAKLIGEAETEVISSDKYIITEDTNYTFIYLLGKTGILSTGILFLAIILTSLKLIINAKNIKEQYGKFLIIGLSILFILQAFASILMNMNLGIRTNINIPFVSCGGFYFLVNIMSMAIIFSIYRRKDINFEEPKKLKLVTRFQKFLFLES